MGGSRRRMTVAVLIERLSREVAGAAGFLVVVDVER
jgi:hypothetical protein